MKFYTKASTGNLAAVCGTGSEQEIVKNDVAKSTWLYTYLYSSLSSWEVGTFVTRDKENAFYYAGESS